jgi:hypothetical protein
LLKIGGGWKLKVDKGKANFIAPIVSVMPHFWHSLKTKAAFSVFMIYKLRASSNNII